jgi:hypothetical protein
MVEKRRTIVRYRVSIVVLLTALIFTLVGFSVAQAVVSNIDGTANACYKNGKGQLRVSVTPCTGKETAITLSRTVPMFANVYPSGSIEHSKHVVSSTHPGDVGATRVTFDRNIQACATSATIDFAVATAEVSALKDGTNAVVVRTAVSGGTPAFYGFDLVVTC